MVASIHPVAAPSILPDCNFMSWDECDPSYWFEGLLDCEMANGIDD